MNENILTFRKFSKYPNLIHGVSTKFFGSMKSDGKLNYSNINGFLTFLNIPSEKLVLAEQVHGCDIVEVDKLINKKYIKGVDGLITAKKNVFLGIMTADCLPILFYDKKKNIIGAAHGGYKGLSKKIINKMIKKFRSLGSDIKSLSVCVGPAIGACCYSVPEDRIEMFQEICPSYEGWFEKNGSQFFLDLKRIAFLNLKEEGIDPKQIEISEICTAHQDDSFFSYRKDGENAGRFMSVIGMV